MLKNSLSAWEWRIIMESYEVTANAKVNLFLKICGKLPNGYHKLFMVMQEIDICDDVTVNIDSSRPAEIAVICNGMDNTDPKKNLCYKAADRFYARYHKKLVEEQTKERIVFPYTEIVLTKRIPSQAGMGGGSSDAAAVLMTLQEHFGNPFSDEEMNEIAVNCGADVPFFLYGGMCLCEGVGEVVTQLEDPPKWPMLIVKPHIGVSTPRSFAQADKMAISGYDREAYRAMFDRILEAGTDLDKVEAVLKENRALFVNDLQAPGIEEVPVIADIIDSLEQAGSPLAMMTGSGSAVFGLFKTEDLAKTARDIIAGDDRFADCDIYVCHMI